MFEKFKNGKFPTIKMVNPLLNLGVLNFAYFNIVLGISLLLERAEAAEHLIVVNMLSYPQWGLVFLSSGLTLLLGHLLNSWNIMRTILVTMVFVKIVWWFALVWRQYTLPETNLVFLLFFSLVTIGQIQLYIHFPTYKRWSWKD